MARKGVPTDDRPHRRSAVLSAPERLEVVPAGLLEALAAECPAEEPKAGKASANGKATQGRRAKKEGAGVSFPETDTSPVDDFEARTDWAEILPAGWHEDRPGYWTRPGKDKGHGATVLLENNPNFIRIYTDNAAPFEPNVSYSKFDAYALLNHGGDEAAAIKDLVAHGFGMYIDHDGSIRRNPPPKDWARRGRTARRGAEEAEEAEEGEGGDKGGR
jgi:hypothetical protein